MGTWYAHDKATTFALDVFPAGWDSIPPYEDRGWTTFESAVSALIKASGEKMWPRFVRASDKGVRGGARPVPLHPEAFAAKLARKVFTNGKSDLEMVAGIYARTLDGALGGARALVFAGCHWGDEEVRALAKILPLARSVTYLGLHDNPIEGDGWNALREAIKAGVAPNLKVISCDTDLNSQTLPFGLEEACKKRGIKLTVAGAVKRYL